MCVLILKFNLNSSIIKSPEKGWGYPVNTEITNALKATSDTAQYDNSAKRLLGNKYILAQILVYTVDEFKGMQPMDVVPLIEGEPKIWIVPVEPGLTNERKGDKIICLNT